MSKWPHQTGRIALILGLAAFFGLGWYAYGFLNAMAASVGGIAAGLLINVAVPNR